MKMIRLSFLPIIICLSFACISRFSADNSEPDGVNHDTLKCSTILDSVLNRQVYTYAQEMPEFPGGESALSKFIIDNIDNKMPQDSFQGSVTVAFIIESDGSVIDAYAPKPYFKNGLSNLEKDLIRIVKEMPKWTPAKCNGKPVPFKFILPLHL